MRKPHQGGKRRNQCKVWSYNAAEDRYEGIAENSLANLAKGPAAMRAQGQARRVKIADQALALFAQGHKKKTEVAKILGVSPGLLGRSLAEYSVPTQIDKVDPLLS